MSDFFNNYICTICYYNHAERHWDIYQYNRIRNEEVSQAVDSCEPMFTDEY